MPLIGSGAATLSWIEHQAAPITHQVYGHDRDEQRKAREDHRPRRGYAQAVRS
jgi:hypothetical protein